ncbi:MAG: hypothetical protein RR813_06160 [Enterococcus sp.]|uniref:hypothetical protein n=1 Tax=Enterococcus sp. TaxID=35783 RepID=UPI002FC8F57E
MDAFFELHSTAASVSIESTGLSDVTLYVNGRVSNTSNGIVLTGEQAKAIADILYALAVRDY